MCLSRGSSQLRNETQVSHIAGRFFTSWANREAQMMIAAAAAAKSLQSCPTLCDPIDGSPPGSPVPGILQARTLEWVAISFSNAWKRKVKGKSLSRVRFLETPWTAAHQAPLSMGFSRQEYWSGVPLPSSGSNSKQSLWLKKKTKQNKNGIKAVFPALAGEFFTNQWANLPTSNFLPFFFLAFPSPNFVYFPILFSLGNYDSPVFNKCQSSSKWIRNPSF